MRYTSAMAKAGEHPWLNHFTVNANGCWIWALSLDKTGYGQYCIRSSGSRKTWRAHRYVYQQLVGPLSDDEHLDHLCRVRSCVNPDHLEPVSHAENVRRGKAGFHNAAKTHCPQGHPYSEANTRLYGNGWRRCIVCYRTATRDAQRRYRARLKEAAASD